MKKMGKDIIEEVGPSTPKSTITYVNAGRGASSISINANTPKVVPKLDFN